MKFIKPVFLSLLLVLASSCTLDLLESPNAVQPKDVDVTLLLNNSQQQLAGLFSAASGSAEAVVRLRNAGGSLYNNIFNPQAFDGVWSTAYAGIMQDTKVIIEKGTELKWMRHVGMAKVIRAYTMLLMVDMFGDVPYKEISGGLDNFNPAVDTGSSVYEAAIAMLIEATDDLTTATTLSGGRLSPTALTPTDLYYANTYNSWVRAANSIRLKALLNLRVKDATRATADINALLADATNRGGLISTAAQNFVFRYGINNTDPDSRHPLFVNNYPAGGGNYMSNHLMWQMYHGWDARQGGTFGDPRIRFYFYRQTATNNTDPNNIRCINTTTLPSHYPSTSGGVIIPNAIGGLPPGIDITYNSAPFGGNGTLTNIRTFCYPTNVGYWGRDHINNEGIPPDNFLRTAWGVYPAGGRFDANVNQAVSATRGMQGAGFQPIMMRSFVQFMLAEATLTLGTTGTLNTYFNNGVLYSINDVRDYAVNGTYGVGTAATTESATINQFYPTTGTLTTAVRVATTANIATLSGLLTVDGIALIAGDRVLVKNQSTTQQNGIYDVAAGAWTRSTSSDTPSELVGQAVDVTSGTVNSGARFVQITPSSASFTVGSTSSATAIVWGGSFNFDRDAYAAKVLAAFTAGGANQLNILAREYWVASFCNGVEAYNLYRRTGMPTGMQPALAPAPGSFPRSFWYPNSFVTLNNKADQKANLGVEVFWDNKSANLDF